MTKKNSELDIKNIIFDLGGVLIDWNPDYVFLKVFKGDKLKLKEFYEKYALLNGMKIKMQDIHLTKRPKTELKYFLNMKIKLECIMANGRK